MVQTGKEGYRIHNYKIVPFALNTLVFNYIYNKQFRFDVLIEFNNGVNCDFKYL